MLSCFFVSFSLFLMSLLYFLALHKPAFLNIGTTQRGFETMDFSDMSKQSSVVNG